MENKETKQQSLEELLNQFREFNDRKKQLSEEFNAITSAASDTCMEIAKRLFIGKTVRIDDSYLKVCDVLNVNVNSGGNSFILLTGEMVVGRYTTGRREFPHMHYIQSTNRHIHVSQDFKFVKDDCEIVDDTIFDKMKNNSEVIENAMKDCSGNEIMKDDIVVFSERFDDLKHGVVISFDETIRMFEIGCPVINRRGEDGRPVFGDDRKTMRGEKMSVVKI